MKDNNAICHKKKDAYDFSPSTNIKFKNSICPKYTEILIFFKKI